MKSFKYLFLILMSIVFLNVDAKVKCEDGKPGDTVNCVINNAGRGGNIEGIKADKGLTFVSCDVCTDKNYKIEPNKDATFKFKISEEITESKTLNVSFGGEDAKIKVVVETEDNDNDEDADNDATIYSVTLVPGLGQSNKTLTCTVNSLNTTCTVKLDELENTNFNGWGDSKDCTEGARGSVKVNKNITYYACYKQNDVTTESIQNQDKTLLLKSLIVNNGDERINLGFSIRNFKYEITIPTNVESLEVLATAQNDDTKIEISGNENLTNDNNQIKVILSDDDGNTNEYVINVKKSDVAPKPLLSGLVIGGENIQFEPEKFVYNITIENGISSLLITPSVEKDEYEWSISGNENLKDGSKVSIIVKSNLSNETSTYIINISQETSNMLIYVGIGGIVLIILIILLIMVVRKGKKANRNNQNVQKTNNNLKQKGEVVNNKGNIPEVKPVIPTVPTNSTVVKEVDKNDSIETLDL